MAFYGSQDGPLTSRRAQGAREVTQGSQGLQRARRRPRKAQEQHHPVLGNLEAIARDSLQSGRPVDRQQQGLINQDMAWVTYSEHQGDRVKAGRSGLRVPATGPWQISWWPSMASALEGHSSHGL